MPQDQVSNDNALLLGEIKGTVNLILEDVRRHADKDEVAHAELGRRIGDSYDKLSLRLGVLESNAAAQAATRAQTRRIATVTSAIVGFIVTVGNFILTHFTHRG